MSVSKLECHICKYSMDVLRQKQLPESDHPWQTQWSFLVNAPRSHTRVQLLMGIDKSLQGFKDRLEAHIHDLKAGVAALPDKIDCTDIGAVREQMATIRSAYNTMGRIDREISQELKNLSKLRPDLLPTS